MYNLNLKHILYIYYLLSQNLVDATTDSDHKALPSTKVNQGNARLINGKQYILDVAQEFVYELEEYGFCNFNLSDFSHKIDQSSYFNRIVKGITYYKKGFIGTVDEISLLQDPNDGTLSESENTAEFNLKMQMLNLMTFFDFTADLTETKFSGTVAIPIAKIELNIEITKYFTTGLTTHDVSIKSFSPGIKSVWYYESTNEYTQVINRYADHLIMGDDIESIASNYWNKLLGKVIDKISFPELCLFCAPQK